MEQVKSTELLAEVSRERDLYQRLLQLGMEDELELFLKEALELVVSVSGARRGYLEIRDGEDADRSSFWLAQGCSEGDIESIRRAFSQGVVAEVLATRETIISVSAVEDPRFMGHGSVRENRIEAVLCAPIGADRPFGVIYLQDREIPGAFTEQDRLRVEIFGRHLGTLAERLLLRLRVRSSEDKTQAFRKLLRADGVIGRSEALAAVLKQIAHMAPLDISVLLHGPNGTGKTQFARLLHESGPRATKPFIEVNCATLTAELAVSELFGAMPGSHSTATRRVLGKVDAAQHGTLFLDDVQTLHKDVQAKLLQLLQSREYSPVGGQAIKADIRVVAATNENLNALVAGGKFREDLYYRLLVVAIRVPSLAERREDLPELAAFFAARACEIHRLPRLRLSAGAILAIESAEWPGNIRQLEHAVESAAARAAGENLHQIEARHVFPEALNLDVYETSGLTFQEATRRFQKDLLRRTLEETGWKVTEAAARLDLVRSHVYNLMRAFGLGREGEDS